uniref:BTB domain-containing protein n=1 Tax=Bracon brevicornis TaxID=1563983 RepID=A0A6V7HZT4_9HYME
MPIHQWATNRIEVNCTHFEWRIENFSRQPQSPGVAVNSPIFYSDESNGTQWALKLYCNGEVPDNANHIVIIIGLLTSPHKEVEFTSEISAINPTNGTKLCSFKNTGTLSVNEWCCITKDFLPRKAVLEQNENYLCNDTVTIHFELEIYNDFTVSRSINPLETELMPLVEEYALPKELMTLLNNSDFADVTFIVDKQRIRAHKPILIARNLVFKAMFENESMLESQTGEVEIKDLSSAVLKEMLLYMYTDEIEDRSVAMELLAAAQKYQMEGLKAKCSVIIMEDLKPENAAHSLYFANLYGPPGLREYIIDFVKGHEFEVQQSKGFKELEINHPELLLEIYKKNVMKRRKSRMEVEPEEP